MSINEPTRPSCRFWWPFVVVLIVAVVSGFPGLSRAQGIDLFGEQGQNDLVGGGTPTSGLTLETSLTTDRFEPGGTAMLSIQVEIPSGFHLYSMDPGNAANTKIELETTPGLEPIGEFRPDHPPKREFDATLDQEVEKFTGRVTFSQVFRINDPATAKIAGTFRGTYCSTGAGGLCLRANEKFATTLIQAAPLPAHASDVVFTSIRTPELGDNQPGPATLRFSLSPENAQPGDQVTLSATMTLGKGWHTYSLTQSPGPGALPTTFTLKQAQGLTPVGSAFSPDQKPQLGTLETGDGERAIEKHSDTVVWSRQFRVDEADYGIEGAIRYLTCEAGRCLQPQTVAFALGHLDGAGPVPEAIARETADPLSEEFVSPGMAETSLPLYLGLAFLGGMLLNIMPCVLPVVAIKVMSFVQQGGEERGRVFVLNAVYAAGVISVFLFLAALAALPHWFGWLFTSLGLETGEFGWGGLFQSDVFNVMMICLVFAMGLSLLGVFEIPIPGMIGSAAGSAQREGLTGAFLTGIFATLLATPCSGPLIGPILAWSVRQPPDVTFLVWATMGLGMAAPYLVFGLVPGAVKLLPKPGPWMVQFKQLSGFVLMGTVIWLMSILNTTMYVPLMIMLLGIAVGLWMIGMVQFSHSAMKRRLVSVAGLSLGVAVAVLGYQLTLEPTHKLAWEPFSTERVNELRSEGRTVLIDFTADWCANCKVNERIALNTEDTKAFVEEHDVVALMADYTEESPEIREWLDRFQRNAIPLTVIFPADRPNDPILLDGVFTERALLDKLRDAVQPAIVADATLQTAERH